MVLNVVGLQIAVPDLIWSVINFFILFFLLKKFLFKPIFAFMDKRNAKIMEGVSAGLQAKREMSRAEAEAEAQLAEGSREAREISEAARKDGEIRKKAKACETKEQARRNEEVMIQAIEAEKEEMQQKLDAKVPEYVAILRSRLLKEGKK